MTFLSVHLDTLDLSRELLVLMAKTENLERILARTEANHPNDTAAQADLSILINLQRIVERILQARIELRQGGLGDFVPAMPPGKGELDRWDRRLMLEDALREWNQNLEPFKKRYKEVCDRVNEWEAGKNSATVVQIEQPIPAEQESKSRDIAAVVARKLENPAGYPTMSFKEAGHALGKSVPSIRRYCYEGTLEKRKGGRVLTESVIKVLKSAPAD